jgi:hypothetical protein
MAAKMPVGKAVGEPEIALVEGLGKETSKVY